MNRLWVESGCKPGGLLLARRSLETSPNGEYCVQEKAMGGQRMLAIEKKIVILPVIVQKKGQMRGRQKIESPYKAKREAAGSGSVQHWAQWMTLCHQ